MDGAPEHEAGTIVERLRARTRTEMAALVRELGELVAIPSVSAAGTGSAALDASAEAVAELVRAAGVERVEILRAPAPDGRPGAPAVVGHRPGPPGALRVLLYAHHDVQPAGETTAWSTPPFEATRRGDRLYGRGAADDKAGIIAHVGALRVLGRDARAGDPLDGDPLADDPLADDPLAGDAGLDVTVLVEGEEEIGSPSSAAFLERYRDRLAADVVVVADSANWRVGVPALTTSLRGLVDVVVEVSVLEHPVHSGLYGGPVLDALTTLARLLATLHDDRGGVAVPGLVRDDAADVEYAEADFRADAAVLDGVRLAGSGPLAARLWTHPALAVIGLDAPSVAQASNTILASARARLSLRIAPGQDPLEAERALADHLGANAPFGARVQVQAGERGQPFRVDAASGASQAAHWAMATAWGTPAVETGVGGSIPIVAQLQEAFPEASILVTGIADPDSRVHGVDESMHLGELERIVLAEALLLWRLGRSRRGPASA